MEEYRLKVTVRNNLLLSAIENAGYKTQSEFARACELSPQSIQELVAMRCSPINQNGEFRPVAKVIMEILGACPSDLWTESQLTMELNKNTSEIRMSEANIYELLESNASSMTLDDPFDVLFEKQKKELMDSIVNKLSLQKAKIIKLRFEADLTLKDIGKLFDVTKERIRQQENNSLRKLRHPNMANEICHLVDRKPISIMRKP